MTVLLMPAVTGYPLTRPAGRIIFASVVIVTVTRRNGQAKDYTDLLASISAAETELPPAYHHGEGYRKDKRGWGIPIEKRPVIALDGEGLNVAGPAHKYPQRYVLFGWATSDGREGSVTKPWLEPEDIFGELFRLEEETPEAIYVGYGFKYDMQQIAQRLGARFGNGALRILHTKQAYSWRGNDGYSYYISKFHLGKTFTISRYRTELGRDGGYSTVTVFDILPFFGKRFIDALQDFGIGEQVILERVIAAGKAARGTQEEFSSIPSMRHYMMYEVRYLVELFLELRDRAIKADLVPAQWHGPATLATVLLKRNRVRQMMDETHIRVPAVHDAALRAYVGGRFENPLMGRIEGPIYGYDINSAYPAATRLLPNLRTGEWVHTTNPRSIARFGLYHIRVTPTRKQMLTTQLGPLAHRDVWSNITYPWINDTWCWSPEAHEMLLLANSPAYNVEIVEGWELRAAEYGGFDFVNDVYHKRRAMKDIKDPAEIILKLALNSMYGKFAQRVGWNEEHKRAPAYHQIEWAGYITSWCRAQIFALARRISKLGYRIIAIETDGIYTDAPPHVLGISDSKELGGWGVTEFQEIMYLQSGVYQALTPEGKWVFKTRGIERGETNPEALADYLRQLSPNPNKSNPWPTFTSASRQRYVGIGTALMRKGSPLTYLGRWEPYAKEVAPGAHGKRMHLAPFCSACAAGATAYDMAHDLVIRSTADVENPHSAPHSLPWMQQDKDTDEPWWRVKTDIETGDVKR